MSCIAADVINDVSLSLNDSPLVCKELAANSETVSPETFNVTAPVVPPPDNPVPAVTDVISPLPPPLETVVVAVVPVVDKDV